MQAKHAMANPEHLKILKQDVEAWNKWRQENPDIIPDLSGAGLTKADLTGANLSGANLSGANLRRADLVEADLSGADLSGAHLGGVDLTRANLSGVGLVEADLSGADLRGAHLSGVGLKGANLKGANLGQANLSEANLREANLFKAKLSGANLNRANLSWADLTKADLRAADLSGANLSGGILIEANLTRADLQGANLAEVMFADTEGYSALLERAILVGARLTRKGEGGDSRGFHALATAEGLGTADFGDPDFLPRYLADAFDYTHQQELGEKEESPGFVETAVMRIKLLRRLYSDAQPPQALVEAVTTISDELIKYLAKHPEELYRMRPGRFEDLIAEILASFGWEVKLTPATRDGGYDIFAISKDTKTATQTSWIIECKKRPREKKIGVEIVCGLYGLNCELRGVGNAMLATTCDFNRDAERYKASRYDLALKTYQGILEWLNTYRPNPNGRLHIKDNKLIVPGRD